MLPWLIELFVRFLAWAIGVAIMVAVGAGCLVYLVIRVLLVLAFGAPQSEGRGHTQRG